MRYFYHTNDLNYWFSIFILKIQMQPVVNMNEKEVFLFLETRSNETKWLTQLNQFHMHKLNFLNFN